MNKKLMVALGVALVGIPALAFADAMVMSTMDPPSNSATMMCRTTTGTEKSTAMQGSQPLVCKSMAPMMTGGKMQVPDTTKMNSAAEADRAWRQWIQQSLIIPPGGTGGGG